MTLQTQTVSRGPDCACCEKQPCRNCDVPGCTMKEAPWALPLPVPVMPTDAQTDLLSRSELERYFRTEEYADEIADIISNFPPAESTSPAQGSVEIQNKGNRAVVSDYSDQDIRWGVNYLLEQIAAKFETWDTLDLFRSEAAATVRSFKHALAAQPPAAPVETKANSSDGGGESRPASTEPQASASRRPQGLIGEAGVAPSPSDAQCSAATGEDILSRLDDHALLSKAERMELFKEAAAEIRRLRGEPQTVGVWQPIGTAPKDGTEFIGYENGDVYRCCWRTEEPDEGPGHSGWYDFSNQSFENPTEWSPLSRPHSRTGEA